MLNKRKKKFSLKDRIKSLRYALRGLKVLWQSEHNARIHLVAFILVILAGLFFKISTMEWIIVLIVSFMVMITELFNTSLEYLSDKVSSEHDELIGKSKDLSAAAVLLSAMLAVICGLVIFLPYIISSINVNTG